MGSDMTQITNGSFFVIATVLAALSVGCHRSSTAVQPANAITDLANNELTLLEQMAREDGDQRNDQQIRRDNAFIDATEQRQLAKAVSLLNAGADPSARYVDDAFVSGGRTGQTALLHASRNGDVDAVQLLLEHTVDLNYQCRGKSALYMAVTQGHDELAKLLKAAGADGDPDEIQKTNNLIRAACKGFELRIGEGYPPYPGTVRDTKNAPTIIESIESGGDVNAVDPEGYTPLMYAANLGLIENVKTLLAKGADPSRKSIHGDTAASLASGDSSVNREQRAQVVELLWRHNSNGQ